MRGVRASLCEMRCIVSDERWKGGGASRGKGGKIDRGLFRGIRKRFFFATRFVARRFVKFIFRKWRMISKMEIDLSFGRDA